jgi:hypothetical protein
MKRLWPIGFQQFASRFSLILANDFLVLRNPSTSCDMPKKRDFLLDNVLKSQFYLLIKISPSGIFFCQSIHMSVVVGEVIFNSKLSFEHDLIIWFTLHLFFGPNSYLVYYLF